MFIGDYSLFSKYLEMNIRVLSQLEPEKGHFHENLIIKKNLPVVLYLSK